MELLLVSVPSLIAAIGGVAAAYITSKAKQEQEQAAKDNREYREKREKLDIAKNGVLLATMEGVTVLLKQAKGQNLNGDVDESLKDITEARDRWREVRNEISAQY